jgi:hypothetical protein
MRFRKLRIAWSVIWALLVVLLIVLWVRSNYWVDVWAGPQIGSRLAIFETCPGACGLGLADVRVNPWSRLTVSSDAWWNAAQKSQPGFYKSWFWGLYAYGDDSIIVPFYFAIGLAAVATAVPWIRWPKRYRLRTLLIATTLVAVVLGLVMYVATK